MSIIEKILGSRIGRVTGKNEHHTTFSSSLFRCSAASAFTVTEHTRRQQHTVFVNFSHKLRKKLPWLMHVFPQQHWCLPYWMPCILLERKNVMP